MNIFWFRRDLRLNDNAGLYHALKEGKDVLPVFIFDKNILDKLENKKDKRVLFIFRTIENLKKELQSMGSDLKVFYGEPLDIFRKMIRTYQPDTIYTNKDFEPYAIQRDLSVKTLLDQERINFTSYKDHVIFESDEVLKDDYTPYIVYTPYSKKWKTKLTDFYLESYPNSQYFKHFLKMEPEVLISLESLGFHNFEFYFPSSTTTLELIQNYDLNRDIPSIAGTSRLSLHLRFGTVSIRELVRKGKMFNEKWLNELIWRDFYMQILVHFPHVVVGAFKPAYNKIMWRNNENEFKLWCTGKTGYPIVDAGMRELNVTGFMHNRVRMIVASFLTKHLLIDWRWGEAYFKEKLLDFELASNNGGWQWAAGCGVDAAPYFRVFNPYLQTVKFDPQYIYIKQWLPEFGTAEYPAPMVEHSFARDRCLAAYNSAIKLI